MQGFRFNPQNKGKSRGENLCLFTRPLLDRREELWAHSHFLPFRKLIYSGALKVSEAFLKTPTIYICSDWKWPKPAQLVLVLNCVGWIWRCRPSWRRPRCPFYAKACGSFKSWISRGCWAPSTLSQHSRNLTAHCVVVVSMYHSLLSKTLFKLKDQCSLKIRFKRTSFPP